MKTKDLKINDRKLAHLSNKLTARQKLVPTFRFSQNNTAAYSSSRKIICSVL